VTPGTRSAPSPPPRPAWPEVLGLLLLIALGIARIADTYHTLSETLDEPAHLASGLQWIDTGEYTYNRMHPPLSRAFVALGPYLDGVRSVRRSHPILAGNDELQWGGNYWRNLTLARIGVLPFFVLAVLGTWSLARGLFGPVPAMVAAAAFTMLPPVLAHAGLATTDMAITSMIPIAVVAAMRWLDQPDREATVTLGVAGGIAMLLKFSAMVFIPACLAFMLAAKLIIEPGTSRTKVRRWRRLELPTLGVLWIAFMVIWAGYRFSFGSLDSLELGALAPPWLARLPILPAPEFWHGLAILTVYRDANLPSYSLGEVTPGGTLHFFPLALAVKTPLAFLAVALLGAVVTVQQAWRHRQWRFAAPAACALAILGSVMISKMAFGSRHILPIYTVLSAMAGAGALILWHLDRRRIGRAVVAALGMWLLIASFRAHPDYLSDFNEIAAGRPEHFLVNSDLDWGQDIGRLADTLHARGIDSVTTFLAGFYDKRVLGPMKYVHAQDWLVPITSRPTGWVAASAFPLYENPRIDWLVERTPVARVGTSIFLYFLPPDSTPRP
jgi:hypothetical protein